MNSRNSNIGRWAVVCGFAVVIICLASCYCSSTYVGFLLHSKNYYAEIAETCDQLFVQNSVDRTGKRTIAGNDPSLPHALQSLHPTYVVINEVGVLVEIRTTFGSYSIQWYRVFDGDNRWQLEAQGEGARHVVFFTNKVASIGLHLPNEGESPGKKE
jgi:hypothetical protein